MTNWAGCRRRMYDTIDSTNKEARLWARQGAPHGAVIVAKTQTAGRGRQGRTWESPPGAGLWLSILLRPAIKAEEIPLLPFAIALAAADACARVSRYEIRIKWPNDLLLGNQKVAGILLEKEGDAVIAGIGVNVNQQETDFPVELRQKATSLKMHTDVALSIAQLENELLREIEKRLDDWDFLDEYQQRCMTIGTRVRVLAVADAFDGVATGIDSTGALLVRDDTGRTRAVYAADVSIRGVDGYV